MSVLNSLKIGAMLVASVVVLCVASCKDSDSARQHTFRKHSEKRIGLVPINYVSATRSESHLGCRLAFIVRSNADMIAVIDGVGSASYNEIDSFVFSPDGRRYAYRATQGGKQKVVVDGAMGDEFDKVQDIAFAPDGSQLAFLASTNGHIKVVIDGEAAAGHDGAAPVLFAPRGRRTAYITVDNGISRLVLDGAAGPGYRKIGGMRFSPDGRRFAYWGMGPVLDEQGSRGAGRAVVSHVIVDGVASRDYITIGSGPVFSPDSRRLAYVAMTEANTMVGVADGTEQVQFKGMINAQPPVFSGDSASVAFVAPVKDSVAVVVDGERGGEYSRIVSGYPIANPRLSSFAYVARPSTDRDKWVVVHDGQTSREYDSVAGIRFSSDGTRFGYFARNGEDFYVMIDTDERGPFKFVGKELVFAPKSSRAAYAVRRDGRVHMVVGDSTGPACDGLQEGAFRFDPSGENWAYPAEIERRWHMVVNGTPDEGWDAVWAGPVFKHNGSLEFIAEQIEDGERVLYRVVYR